VLGSLAANFVPSYPELEDQVEALQQFITIAKVQDC